MYSVAVGPGGKVFISGDVAPAGGARYALAGTVGQPNVGTRMVGTYVQQGGLIPAFT